MKGVYGRILNIDLTQKTSFAEEIPDRIYKTYLGGKGLATYLLYQRNKPKIDPLSPENHLIIGLGPAVDSKVWGSSRYGIFTLSPQTGILAHSYSGGRVAEYMGRAGFDAFVISGAASSPTALEISDEGVTFHDGSELWGMDTYQAQDALQKMVGTKAGTMVIGPAGENLVRFAMVANNYWRCAGRGGVGAVLGSKNIKGLAFHGTAAKEIAEPEILNELWKQIRAGRKNNPVIQAFNKYGTSGLVSVVNKAGAFPTRYWSKGYMDGWKNIDAEALHSKCDVVPNACAKCLMACGRLTKVKEGRHKGLKVEGPEYETIYAFGGLCEIEQIEEIIYLNDICDRLGIDTISAGNLAAFAIEASKRGIIKECYEYRDPDAVSKLLEDIVYRRGIGKVLAEGIRYAAKQWGMEDVAIHVKGMEPSAYDPRVLKGMGLAFATSDRGACHLRSTVFKAELSGQIAPDQIEGKAEICMDYEDRLTLQDALIVCRFYRDIYVWDILPKIIRGTTGMILDQRGLKKIAANIRDISQRFNRREGITRKEDTLPERFFTEPVSGGKVIRRSELDKMLQEYYKLRGWDEQGEPSGTTELYER
jgi:aldehyde:ferredoxin oxidoreductase